MKINKNILILLIFGLTLYFNSLFNSFVWDDEELIVNNPQVHSILNLPAFLSGSTFNSGGAGNLSGLYYKPLMTISFSAIYTLFGPNPFFFHLFQVLIHLSNTVLIYLIFKKLIKNPSLVFFLSLIFLVHPVNTEAVVYVADLQDVLNFFFGALALYLNLPFLLLFSLLSKETGIVWVGIMFLYLYFFKKESLKKFFLQTGIAVFLYAFLRFGVAHIFFNKHGLAGISTIPFIERMINVPKILFTYLSNFIWPHNLAINQQWIIKDINISDFWFPLAIIIIFFAILFTGLFSRKKVYLFFLLWFLGGLFLHLQIFPLDLTVSDRWFYLPMAGLLGLFGAYFSDLKIRPFFYLLIFVLAIRSFIRCLDWRNGLTLYSHDVAISRDAFDLENNLGVELFRAGKTAEAKIHFEKSTQLSPQWWTNWNNLGAIIESEGDYVTARNYYQKAIDNGNYYLAYENMAKLLYKLNKNEGIKFAKENLLKLPYNFTLQQISSQKETPL